MMATTIPADEIGERLGELLGLASKGQEVILERDGQAKAVVMSPEAYAEVQRLRDAERRRLAGEELFRLREEVRSRNRDLSEEQAEEIAGNVIRDAVDSLAERGALVFERDHPSE
jgi:hypothetical protein